MNEQNLKPIRKGELTKEEAKKRGSNGGKKSAEVRREKKLIRERILEKIGESDWDEMIDGVIERAKNSDKGFEILRDTIGEKPIERTQNVGSQEDKDNFDALINAIKSNAKDK